MCLPQLLYGTSYRLYCATWKEVISKEPKYSGDMQSPIVSVKLKYYKSPSALLTPL